MAPGKHLLRGFPLPALGKEPLELAVKILGADHIIYGSSYPVKMAWMMGGPQFVRNLDISDEEKELILHGNAERIYGV